MEAPVGFGVKDMGGNLRRVRLTGPRGMRIREAMRQYQNWTNVPGARRGPTPEGGFFRYNTMRLKGHVQDEDAPVEEGGEYLATWTPGAAAPAGCAGIYVRPSHASALGKHFAGRDALPVRQPLRLRRLRQCTPRGREVCVRVRVFPLCARMGTVSPTRTHTP